MIVRSSLSFSLAFGVLVALSAGCSADASESTDSASAAIAVADDGVCTVCAGDDALSDEDFDQDEVEIDIADDGTDNGGGGGGLGIERASGLQLLGDTVIDVSHTITVQVPQVKGDRCHAGGVPVHLTVIDSTGTYKMKPVRGPGGTVVWATVDGRPNPSNRTWNKILGNPDVLKGMSKITKAAGFCVAAFMLIGYDNYVSAGEQIGYNLLDRIKSMRTMQDICSPDENGVMQPRLPRSGTLPGGAGSGRDLRWEVIYSATLGWIYTSFYYEPDCGTIESLFGCNTVKKVWVVGPDKQMQVPNGCLINAVL